MNFWSMTVKVVKLAAILGLTFASAMAQAVLMDFEGFSDSNTTEGTINTFSSGAFTVTLSAGSSQGGTGYDPYLDYGNAGVGVCKNSTAGYWPDATTSNKCRTPDGSSAAAGDDNLQYLEFLRLDFGQLVTITDLFFRDSHHHDLNGNVLFAVDSGGFGSSLFTNGLNGALSFTGNTLDITIGANDTELYLSRLNVRSVPEPGSFVLLGLGLLSLGFARRKT